MADPDVQEVEEAVRNRAELASVRYKLLVNQILDELGDSRGSKSEAARRLGVGRSYISKIASGQAGEIGTMAIHKAITGLGLARRFFFDPDLDPLDYRSWLLTRDDLEAVPMPIFERWKREFQSSSFGAEQAAWRSILRRVEDARETFHTRDPEELQQLVADFWAQVPQADLHRAMSSPPGPDASRTEQEEWARAARRAIGWIFRFCRAHSADFVLRPGVYLSLAEWDEPDEDIWSDE